MKFALAIAIVGTLFDEEELSMLRSRLQKCVAPATDSCMPVAATAVQSLVITHYARMHGNDQSLLHRGLTLYGQALIQLVRGAASDLAYDQNVMLATVALYFFELMVNTSELGWVHQAGGIGDMMQIRGPKIHQVQPMHEYLLFRRRIILAQAFCSRRRCFLERAEWKVIPWEVYPHTKTSEQVILDILSSLPGLQQDLDLFNGNGVSSHFEHHVSRRHFLKRLRQKIIVFCKDLIQWRYDWEVLNGKVITEADLSRLGKITAHLDRPSCLDTVYYYTKASCVREIQLYNTCMLWVLFVPNALNNSSIMREIWEHFPLQTRPEARNPLFLPHEDLSDTDMAIETLRSIDYNVLPHHPRRFLLQATIPLRTW